LAKVILSFPATSASTERHFSEAGVLISKKKAQLDPLNAQKIMFIHDNFSQLKNLKSENEENFAQNIQK
jgi:hAT family C-terminal dimerisation region